MLESLSVGETTLAKVFDIIEQQNKKTKPVQQLAGQAGLPAAPTTASGTGALGGTPQQQAMAGTPAQKKSVFEAVTKVAGPQGETQLEQARTLRGPAEATTESEAKKALTARIVSSMGTFGAKASEFVDSAMKSVTGTSTAAAPAAVTGTVLATEVDVKDQIIASVPDDKKEAVKTLLKQLADPNTPKEDIPGLEVSLNTLLGRDVNSMLSPEQKRELYTPTAEVLTKTGGTTVAGAIAGSDQKLTISDLTTLGTTPAELASILGISEADVGNLTIGQLQERLTAKGQSEFAPVQATTAGMASGLLSSTERAALRDTLRTLEETGVAGAATQYASLLEDIDKGTTVTIGNQQFSVEELASSQQMTDIINQYLTNPAFAKDLAAAEPELVAWIEKNKEALDAAVVTSVAATTGLKQIQADVAKKFENIPSTVINTLGAGPDSNGFYTKTPTIVEGSTLDYVTKLPAAERGVAGATLERLAEAGEDVSKYTPEQIAARELTDVNGRGARYAAYIKDQKKNAAETDPEAQLDNVVSGDYSISDMNSTLADAMGMMKLGLPTGNIFEFDTNSDGKIDAADTAALNKAATSNTASFDDWSKGKADSRKAITAPPLSVDQQTLASSARDGTITAEEVQSIPIDTLSKMAGQMPAGKFPQSLDAIIDQRSNEELASAGVPIATGNDYLNITMPANLGSDPFNRDIATFGRQVDSIIALANDMDKYLTSNISERSKNKIRAMQAALRSKAASLSADFRRKFPSAPAPSAPPPPVSGPTTYRPDVNRETFEGF